MLCSAKLLTIGPKKSTNRPEKRSYKLVIRLKEEDEDENENEGKVESEQSAPPDNIFVREKSFNALLNHELGTHLCRNINEGLQPWYSDRKKFKLNSNGNDREMLIIEEGLAAIHTALEMPIKQLLVYALLYVAPIVYAENVDEQMVKESRRWRMDLRRKNNPNPPGMEENGINVNENENLTFDHIITKHATKILQKTRKILQKYCDNEGYINRIITRCQKNHGRHDQSYFLGAYFLLKNRKTINFQNLMNGRLMPCELNRVERISRKFGLKVPAFIGDSNYGEYKRQLDIIARANFID